MLLHYSRPTPQEAIVALEIERKFLVRDDTWRAQADQGTAYRQGYLSKSGQSTVRVRLAADEAWITIKGAVEGLVRSEYEYPIPTADAAALLDLCTLPVIEKTRFLVEHSGHTWEVDVFAGANAGLIVAEVELDRADAVVALPSWVGDEVSHDPRYKNSSLSTNPFSRW